MLTFFCHHLSSSSPPSIINYTLVAAGGSGDCETVTCVDHGVESVAADAALFAAQLLQGEGTDSLMFDMCDGVYLLVSGASLVVVSDRQFLTLTSCVRVILCRP